MLFFLALLHNLKGTVFTASLNLTLHISTTYLIEPMYKYLEETYLGMDHPRVLVAKHLEKINLHHPKCQSSDLH